MEDKREWEGVVLQATPYGEEDRILTFFSREGGLLRLFSKGKWHRGPALTPLLHADLLLSKGRSDLFRCHEVKVRQVFASLRENYLHLQTACEMVNAVLRSQYPHKPAPYLYDLFLFYLIRLAQAPQTVAASFYLKILVHEGVLECGEKCATCQIPLKESYLAQGQPFCQRHAPAYARSFSEREWQQLRLLAHGRSFANLAALEVSPLLLQRCKETFEAMV